MLACSLGLGMGIFPELKLTHLIPSQRVTEEYLLRLHEGASLSYYLVMYKWKNQSPDARSKLSLKLSAIKGITMLRGIDRKTHLSSLRAKRKANALIESISSTHAQ
jgi:hypothetical protein